MGLLVIWYIENALGFILERLFFIILYFRFGKVDGYVVIKIRRIIFSSNGSFFKGFSLLILGYFLLKIKGWFFWVWFLIFINCLFDF